MLGNGADAKLFVVLPEVGLARLNQESKYDEANDGYDGLFSGAVLVSIVRMADGDVTFDGERQDEERTEMLSSEEEHWNHFAESRKVEDALLPGIVEVDEDVEEQEEEIIERQGCQITSRRRPHLSTDPDEKGKQISWKSDGEPEKGEISIDWSNVWSQVEQNIVEIHHVTGAVVPRFGH